MNLLAQKLSFIVGILGLFSVQTQAAETGFFRVQANDGVTLHVRRFLVKEPRKVLIVAHGLLEHSGRWAEFAERMQSEGYSAYAADHRGHGLSGGPRGHVTEFNQYLLDLRTVMQEVQAREPGKDIVLVGYSLGGLMGLLYGCSAEGLPKAVKGMIAVSPGWSFDPPVLLNFVATILNNPVTGRLKAKPLESDLLTNSPDELEKYLADPLVNQRVSLHMGRELVSVSQKVPGKIHAWKHPLLVLQASADKIIDVQANSELLEQLSKDVSVREVRVERGALHDLFHNQPEQVEPLYREILSFLREI